MDSLAKTTFSTFCALVVLYAFFFLHIDQGVAHAMKPLAGGTLFCTAENVSLLARGTAWMLVIPLGLFAVVLHDQWMGQHPWSRAFMYILVSIIVAITIGAALKYLLGRYRPIELLDYGKYGFHFLTSVWTMNSSPSGHSYRIFALMTALAVCCKRYRALFIIIAVLVGISRIIVNAHYPSDVFFGAFVGTISALYTRRIMYPEEGFF